MGLHETFAGPHRQMQLARSGRSKPRGLTSEQLDARLAEDCADVLGHILLFARRHGVDLSRALDEKWLRWERDAPSP